MSMSMTFESVMWLLFVSTGVATEPCLEQQVINSTYFKPSYRARVPVVSSYEKAGRLALEGLREGQ